MTANDPDPRWVALARTMGEIVRRKRESQGLSQDEVAKRIGIRQRQWSDWETAHTWGRHGRQVNLSNLEIPNVLMMERALNLPEAGLLKLLFPAAVFEELDFEEYVGSVLDAPDVLKEALIYTWRAATQK